MHDRDGGVIMSITCRGDRFSGMETFFRDSKSDPHPELDYIAAGIFGFTGWRTEKVIQTAADVWKTKLQMTLERKSKRAKTFENVGRPGLCATISYSEFALGNCSD